MSDGLIISAALNMVVYIHEVQCSCETFHALEKYYIRQTSIKAEIILK